MPSEVKKHKTTKKPDGQPRKEIDKKVFEGLCSIMCTKNEICQVMDVSEKTISNWCQETYGKNFQEAYERLSQNGRASLRRNQFELSKKNATMAIFLGKQYLGQKDIPEESTEETISKVQDIIVSIKRTAETQQKEPSQKKTEKEGLKNGND
jgi:hypothetical protein